MDLNFQWRKNLSQYQTGESLYLNKIRVGSYHWNDMRPRGIEDETTLWAGKIYLPSLTDNTKRVYGGDETEVKLKIEGVVTRWFNRALRNSHSERS